MIKKAALLIVTFFIVVAASAQADSTSEHGSFNFSLQECLQYAMSNSYARQSRLLNEESSLASYEQSKNNRYPSVNASASETMTHTGSNSDVNFSGNVGINASATIYNGGNIKNTIEQNRLQNEQSKIQTSQYDDNLKIQILNEYLTALSCIERLKYQEFIMNSSREELARGEKQYNLGAMIESDYLMLQAQYQSDVTDSLNTVISLENSLLNLKNYMSMDPEAELTIKDPDTTAIDEMALLPTQQETVAKAKLHMPDMQLAQSTIELANTALEISKSGRRPSLTASAGINTGHNDFDNFGQQLTDRFSQSVGLTLSYPIWDRGATKLQITKAKIQQQQAELDYKQTEQEITRTVVNQYKATNLEYQRYLAYQQKKDAYAASFEAYRMKFNVGSIIAVDLLQQQNNYINVLNSYINAKYGFILNRLILDVYTGENVDL
jgi:outer membrane protein